MSLFTNIDPATVVPQLIADFESQLGVTLNSGDQRREFLQAFGYVFTTLLSTIETTGESNLVAYAAGDALDALGTLLGVTRQAATAAVVSMQFTLSGAQSTAVTVPSGTRVTPDGTVFFATDETLTIASGVASGTVTATATETGAAYNDFVAGQIAQLVDGVSYVSSVTNTDESSGGADIESDEDLRTRILSANAAFSVAGPSDAYRYFAMSASNSVADVYVTQLSAGIVGIYVVKTGGVVPDAEDDVIAEIYEACSASDKRPLTDNVSVLPAVAASTSLDVTYYISEDDTAVANSIESAVSEAVDAYATWQTEKIGRAISPDYLRKLMLNAGALRVEVTAPSYAVIAANEVAQFTSVNVAYGGLE